MTAVSNVSAAGAVVLTQVRRSFGSRTVLESIDLAVQPGEFLALLGHSGSGKSTLLRILAGLDPEFDGGASVPRRRAVVFQEPRLLPWKRVLANVTLGLEGAGAVARARTALNEVGLRDHERAWPVTLSGGEAQRAALARALVREPDLLLLDEPFGALDALTRLRMQTLLADLCRRHRPAVVLVTHDVDEAILLADRVVVLSDGQLSLDLPISADMQRRGTHAFSQMRARLLRALGVDDDVD